MNKKRVVIPIKILKIKKEHILRFKSDTEYFNRCKKGLKSETLREFDLSDDRFTLLFSWKKWEEKDQLYLEFINKGKTEEIYIVEVVDIDWYKTLCKIKFKHICDQIEIV
ncbi:hypothetical protein H3N56_11460 [Cetobacterium sp. 2A]|uniref:hypothetical protein n=1 Tax=Cetobacterium sp. 2A TaxID=2754723 RepID=UPI00163C7282|nr:hypothetical protein [Cetobacterium sp. 2A]MBC2857049.1 hypothetical protein [Cetobacterium sp. 2A]